MLRGWHVGVWLPGRAGMPHCGTAVRPYSLGLFTVIRDGHGLSHPQVCPRTKAQGPTGPTPGSAGGASVRKGHLRGAHEREIRVHWRQESSLCKGTEVWEGRVWCLGEQSESEQRQEGWVEAG